LACFQSGGGIDLRVSDWQISGVRKPLKPNRADKTSK
jgi:hypothetical protein